MTADELARFLHEASSAWGRAHGRNWAAWERQTDDYRDCARAIAEAVLRELGCPAPLVVDAWTREPPRADGYWWYRWDGHDTFPVVVLVRGPVARFGADWHPLAAASGEWLGPLVPPGRSESP